MESWREELHNFTNQLGFSPSYVLPGRLQEGLPEARSRTGANMYSSETGRLIPPPSRAMSRQGPRLSLKERLFNQMSEQSYQTEMENQVSFLNGKIFGFSIIPNSLMTLKFNCYW